jgi:hypothetical protein
VRHALLLRCSLSTAAVLTATMSSIVPPPSATAAEMVTFRQVGPTTFEARITEPDVNHSSKEYPQIQFRPGDRVTINAGGCAQTGGAGNTWKRYVDPRGPNSGRLYHGLVKIPGATAGLVRIQSVIGQTLIVPQNPGGTALWLGYEDDGYGDNGYWGHDDGTGDQCKGVGNAFLTLTIERGGAVPNNAAPFDLVWDSVDPNDIPLNPRWGAQASGHEQFPNPATDCPHGFGPPCTNQGTSVDTPENFNAALCATEGNDIHGHVNWMPATYTGSISWVDHQDWTQLGDDDYNMLLDTPGNAGVTAGNGSKQLELEYDSDETIDHFSTSWWSAFHSAVDNSKAAAGALVDRHQAIVTGLAGLDCEHSCHTELHPVWAMAIHLRDDPTDDQWAIFVRNWGNEGFCSREQHDLYLDDNVYTFRLPWRPGATAVAVASTEFLTNNGGVWGPALQPVPTGPLAGANISFGLNDPANQARVNGVLHLRWTGGTSVPAAIAAVTSASHALTAFHVASNVESPAMAERRLNALRVAMSPAQRATFLSQIPKKDLTPDQAKPGVKPAALAVKLTHSKPPRLQARHDLKKLQRDQKRMTALKNAFGGHLPAVQ